MTARWFIWLAAAFLAAGCAGTSEDLDVKDEKVSLVFGYFDMKDAPSSLEWVSLKRYGTPDDRQKAGWVYSLPAKEGLFYHVGIRPGLPGRQVRRNRRHPAAHAPRLRVRLRQQRAQPHRGAHRQAGNLFPRRPPLREPCRQGILRGRQVRDAARQAAEREGGAAEPHQGERQRRRRQPEGSRGRLGARRRQDRDRAADQARGAELQGHRSLQRQAPFHRPRRHVHVRQAGVSRPYRPRAQLAARANVLRESAAVPALHGEGLGDDVFRRARRLAPPSATDQVELLFPAPAELDIRSSDKAIYIGTLRLHRDEFHEVTRAEVRDDFAAANAEFKKKFGAGASLRKALTRKPKP